MRTIGKVWWGFGIVAVFTAAGIYCFQPYCVTGEMDAPANPLICPQFCVRFNDLDNIGITGRHYSGFVMIGIQVSDMTVGTTIANLGMTDVKFPNPLFEGDTIHCTTQVVSKRESKSRPGAGIVEFHHKAFKQDGTLVAECHRQAFMRMRPK